MPTKTDRILGYLPGTFRVSPRPPVLYAVADAFGSELQRAENSLAAVMLSHWVDFADKSAAAIDDLARIAALYGLAPRDDESVEEFRDHLKRYVRTFLDGTVTVQGLLRVTAEVLGVRIADDYKELDSWWRRRAPAFVSHVRLQDDAAALLVGGGPRASAGADATRAEVVGSAPFQGLDLGADTHLRLSTDAIAMKDIVLPPGPSDLQTIVNAINTACGQPCARAEGGALAIASPTAGAASRLDIFEGPNDAAPKLLGLAPRTYIGADASAAELASPIDLSGGADLTTDRFLRLIVDANKSAEVDCADPVSPAHTGLDRIRDAINAALGIVVARHDGHHLILKSPTTGTGSTIAVLQATAQNAAPIIFGATTALATGGGTRPARVTPTRDLSGGVDLSQTSTLRLTVDGTTLMVDVAGVDPAHTESIDIVTAINQAFNALVASPDGTGIALASVTVGPAGRVVVGAPPDRDATLAVLGIRPRVFRGAAATPARLVGQTDLSHGIDVMARRYVALAVDSGPVTTIDLIPGAADPRHMTLAETVAAINATMQHVASDNGTHLILGSPTLGAASRVELVPRDATIARRFVTRAVITTEASQVLLGFVSQRAEGTAATSASVRGVPDLSLGADLRDDRYVRVVVDGHAFDVDCAGVRPRATLLAEVVKAINAAAPVPVASDDGKHLILTSPTSGAGSNVDLGAPGQRDALPAVLDLPPGTTRGRDAARVVFTGLVDLSAGVDLPSNAAIKLAVDGGPPVDVPLTSAAPAHLSATEVASAINLAVGSIVAPIGGSRLVINSTKRGATSKIEFLAPAGVDATPAICGIAAPRSYQGVEAEPPRAIGKTLAASLDLAVARFLRVAVDGGPAQDVDCASEAADPTAVKPADVAAAINKRLGGKMASLQGTRLVLTSPTAGSAGRVELRAFSGGDARDKLLGGVTLPARGVDASPATITGSVVVDGPLDFGKRRWIRVAVNGGAPVTLDVAGQFPEQTSLGEAVTAINRAVPGLASATEDGRLRLTAPTSAGPSTLDVLPLRAIEVVEFVPAPRDEPSHALRSGDTFAVVNDGTASSSAEITIASTRGTAAPSLASMALGHRIRLLTHLNSGDTAHFRPDAAAGVVGNILAPDGTNRPIAAESILAAPLGLGGIVPFDGTRTLDGNPPELQLHNPDARHVVVLRARGGFGGGALKITVKDAAAPPQDPRPAAPRRFDVTVAGVDAYGAPLVETYDAATIGVADDASSLALRVNAGLHFGAGSALVKASEFDKAAALELPLGRSDWMFVDCLGSRYDAAYFNQDHFPDGHCHELGIFDVSRFESEPAEPTGPVFASATDKPEPTAEVTVHWIRFQPGTAALNLPADLPARFGAAFNEGRFGQAPGSPELHAGVVGAPASDPKFLVTVVNARPSDFVKASVVPLVPLGWTAARLPFRKPQYLTLGTDSAPAYLYLSEEGFDGFIQLEAIGPGTWGNEIAVSARGSGPAMYDLEILYRGGRFENARELVRGLPLPAAARELAQPGPIGVLQAKAAGVLAAVTRDGAEPTPEAGQTPFL